MNENWDQAWALWMFTYSYVFFVLPWFHAIVIWMPLMLGIASYMKIEMRRQSEC